VIELDKYGQKAADVLGCKGLKNLHMWTFSDGSYRCPLLWHTVMGRDASVGVIFLQDWYAYNKDRKKQDPKKPEVSSDKYKRSWKRLGDDKGVGIQGFSQATDQNAMFGMNTAAGSVPDDLNRPAGAGVWGTLAIFGSFAQCGIKPHCNASSDRSRVSGLKRMVRTF